MRQEGALKRERALAYSLAQKQWRSSPSAKSRMTSAMSNNKNQSFERNSSGWSWLERWMAAKPWETRLMEQSQVDPSESTPVPKRSTNSKSSEPCSVRVRKNNMTTRISAKPPHHGGLITHSSSSPSSEFRYDESSVSSSLCTSTTPISGNTFLTSDRTEESGNGNIFRPNYMNFTHSTKAKQRNGNQSLQRIQRQSMDEFQFLKKSASLLYNGDSKSSGGSDPSTVNFSRPLYLPTRMDRTSVV